VKYWATFVGKKYMKDCVTFSGGNVKFELNFEILSR